MVRELIEDYIKEHDINSYIDNLWDRVGKKLLNKGVTLVGIDKAIENARSPKVP